jgi:tRNA(fMet)-specific endonuclease VapC
MIVADSDVLIDYLRGKGPGADRVELELQNGTLATTAVTAFELWAGARTARQQRAVAQVLAALEVLPLDRLAAEAAGEVRRTLEAKGDGIGMADALIAGICLAHRTILLTRNRRHFSRVPDLSVVTVQEQEPG